MYRLIDPDQKLTPNNRFSGEYVGKDIQRLGTFKWVKVSERFRLLSKYQESVRGFRIRGSDECLFFRYSKKEKGAVEVIGESDKDNETRVIDNLKKKL